jgi:Pup-ligase protein
MARILSLETEYALAFNHTGPLCRTPGSPGAAGEGLPSNMIDEPRDYLATYGAGVVDYARRHGPGLPGHSNNGVFLTNGARCYLDGAHLEYCVPETTEPADAVRHALAGDRLMASWLDRCDAASPNKPGLKLYKSNFDYAADNYTAWGSHENYSHGLRGPAISSAMLPHLCSRLIFTGAGGFDPTEPLGFALSPRVFHIRNIRPDNHTRGIFHPRKRVSGTDCNRMHVICGESLCGHLGTYLKLGTTAIVLALIEAGITADMDMTPLWPIPAMRAFSGDANCKATARMRSGKLRSALDIQERYLQLAQANADHPNMPVWAPEVLAAWRNTLERIRQRGRDGVATSLDWAIKWGLFDTHCRSAGLSLPILEKWNTILSVLQIALKSKGIRFDLHPDFVLARRAEHLKFQATSRYMREHGLEWNQLADVLRLRLELLEIDWRYAQIGGGIFEQLDRAGVLRHQVPGVEDKTIQHAMQHPPQTSRAKARGRAVRRLSQGPDPDQYMAGWSQITHRGNNRFLDLTDPFMTHPRWRRAVEPKTPTILASFDRARNQYYNGRFESAASGFKALLTILPRWGSTRMSHDNTHIRLRTLRYLAWLQARRGFDDGGAWLRRLSAEGRPHGLSARVSDRLYVLHFQGLAIHPKAGPWIKRARSVMDQQTVSRGGDSELREHLGAHLLRAGLLKQAYEMLLPAVDETSYEWRSIRIRCAMADVCRRLHRTGMADDLLQKATELSAGQREPLLGEHVLPALAKRTEDRHVRKAVLERSAAINRRYGNRMGLARTLLLDARGCDDRRTASRRRRSVRALQRNRPALAQCRLTNRILTDWDDWVCGHKPDKHGDHFWGL